MARLESQAKMGYYPTPEVTLQEIKDKLNFSKKAVLLDPCCGEGYALSEIADDAGATAFGIEPDTDRAIKATDVLSSVLCGSLFDVIVRPVDCFSLLYLNPPYDWQDGERMEFLFLKHSHKWLMNGGLLIFIVPEHVLGITKIKDWIARRYEDIRICKVTKEDFPAFRQVVLFGVKKENEEENFPKPPYPHIEDMDFTYNVPEGSRLRIFELQGLRPEDIHSYRAVAEKNIMETIFGVESNVAALSPLFPLRKGHLVSLLMSGVLNCELKEEKIVFKCFTERSRSIRLEEEDDKEITTDTYVSGIRVIEKGRWYDVM